MGNLYAPARRPRLRAPDPRRHRCAAPPTHRAPRRCGLPGNRAAFTPPADAAPPAPPLRRGCSFAEASRRQVFPHLAGYRSRSMADVIASQWRYTRRRDTTYEMEEYDATIDALFHAAAPGCSGESATVRFTPTCVGTTFSTMPRLYYPSVHPHVRGNNVVTGISPVSSSGSPPRAWGQRQATRENVPEQRFTPTCVGTTIGNGDRRRTASVYLSSEGSPALCVENA
jgi:hypothetical protein